MTMSWEEARHQACCALYFWCGERDGRSLRWLGHEAVQVMEGTGRGTGQLWYNEARTWGGPTPEALALFLLVERWR